MAHVCDGTQIAIAVYLTRPGAGFNVPTPGT